MKNLKKILIIDDDKDILTISQYALKEVPGLIVFSVNNGEDAVKCALESHPDLILLDLMMPNMDGMSILKAIRLIPSIAATPVVFFTARVIPDKVEEYKKLGVVEIILKPFDPINLPVIVQNIWEKYQSLK